MSSSNLSPDDSNARPSDLLLGLVDVRYTFTKVELCFLRRVAALNLQERHIWVCRALGTLIRDVTGLGVQSVLL